METLFDYLDKPKRKPRPRASAAVRGYGYAWRKLRRMFAKLEPPRCCKCGLDGLGRFMHLDHRIAKEDGGEDSPENLQWLCERCHGTKSGKERKARRNASTPLAPTTQPPADTPIAPQRANGGHCGALEGHANGDALTWCDIVRAGNRPGGAA